MLGDNVYGDCRTDGCPELKEAYDALEAHPSYRGAKASLPMLITWDDHDYGLNDGGAANPYRDYAKELFLEFVEAPPDDPRRSRDGVYSAQSFGPAGRRVQVILLDTRFFRADFAETDERYAPGKERHVPVPAPPTRRRGVGGSPAGFRAGTCRATTATCSARSSGGGSGTCYGSRRTCGCSRRRSRSSRTATAGSGADPASTSRRRAPRVRPRSWRMLPRERDRLYAALDRRADGAVVMLSGDRHVGGLYREPARGIVDATA